MYKDSSQGRDKNINKVVFNNTRRNFSLVKP